MKLKDHEEQKQNHPGRIARNGDTTWCPACERSTSNTTFVVCSVCGWDEDLHVDMLPVVATDLNEPELIDLLYLTDIWVDNMSGSADDDETERINALTSKLQSLLGAIRDEV